jgi:hypothetical protein
LVDDKRTFLPAVSQCLLRLPETEVVGQLIHLSGVWPILRSMLTIDKSFKPNFVCQFHGLMLSK